MAIFLRHSYNIPPPRWGNPADIQYAVKVNSEKLYGIDPYTNICIAPLFWGLPIIDYSSYNITLTNYGSYFKNSSLYFNGSGYIIGTDITPLLGTKYTVSSRVKFAVNNENNIFCSLRSTTSATPVYFQLDHNNLDIRLIVRADNSVTGNAQKSGALVLNKTQNIVCARDGDDLYTYVDAGTPATTSNSFGTISANGFVIGGGYTGAPTVNVPSLFKGYIEDIRINNDIYGGDKVRLFNDLPYGLYQKVSRPFYLLPEAPVGAIMNQFQGPNLGADLYNGTLL